jgi:hypothetical protein
MRLRTLLVIALVHASCGPALAASACHAASGAHARPLIELYTSEGCDSCPPAERWLSTRFAPTDDASSPIALAFHVDYWDGPGWVDRFASARYTARQYETMHAIGATFFYTPQVLLPGHDFTAWRAADASAIDEAARAQSRATIAMDATPRERDVAVRVQAQLPRAAGGDAAVFVAYADSGLVSDVKGGENRGRRLAHDHVVRTFERAGNLSSDGRIDATLTLRRPSERGEHPILVAFVERVSNGDVLQALALPLDGCANP